MIHTITPCEDPNKDTFLDEGLAVVFSEKYAQGGDSVPKEAYNFCEARKLVSNLVKIDKEIIKKLRKKYPDKKISDYTTQDIMEEIGNIPDLVEICPSILNLVQELLTVSK